MKNTKKNEVNIIKMEDISREFTESAKQLLLEGYEIDVEHMSGTQGEEAQITFKKDGYAYRLILEKGYEALPGVEYGYERTMTLRFGKYAEQSLEEMGSWGTIWNGKLEELWSKKWCALNDRKGIYTDIDTAVECYNKHWERADRRCIEIRRELSKKSHQAALNALRKTKGNKGRKLSNIVKVERTLDSRRVRYCIEFTKHGKTEIQYIAA